MPSSDGSIVVDDLGFLVMLGEIAQAQMLRTEQAAPLRGSEELHDYNEAA